MLHYQKFCTAAKATAGPSEA